MDEQKLEALKEKMIRELETRGIDDVEVERVFAREIEESTALGMTGLDGRQRALIGTANYYRKYLDKIGNRVKFCCLGMSQPSDFGIGKQVKEIKKKWNDPTLPDDERDKMIADKIVNEHGIPIHTTETTFFEDRVGLPINLEEEWSQNLVGVVETPEGKKFPGLIRVLGKAACDEKKMQFMWTSISGEQGKAKNYPAYVVLNSHELLMKPVKDAKRITGDEYAALVEEHFGNISFDMDDEKDVERMANITGADHIFLKNVRLMNYTFSAYGASTGIASASSIFDPTSSIIADINIPSVLDINVDPKAHSQIGLVVRVRKKGPQDLRVKIDALGMYTENPVDRSKLQMDASVGFFASDENRALADQVKYQTASQKAAGREADAFFEAMEKRG